MERTEIDNSYGLAALQQDLLDIMKFLHGFCIEHDIKYSLTGGSLLGAIRHGGFIPWDDDFDIMLDRANYEKLLSCMTSYEGSDFILEPDQWVYRIRKQHKVGTGFVPCIDLFVIDRVPENTFVNKLQVLRLKILHGMLRDNHKKGDFSLIYRLCITATSVLGKLFSNRKLFEKYDRLSQIGNSGSSKQVSIFNDRFKLISLKYDDSLMEEYVLHKFEDTEFYITSKYDYYLTLQFGDYMQLPPENERVPMHCD